MTPILSLTVEISYSFDCLRVLIKVYYTCYVTTMYFFNYSWNKNTCNKIFLWERQSYNKIFC